MMHVYLVNKGRNSQRARKRARMRNVDVDRTTLEIQYHEIHTVGDTGELSKTTEQNRGTAYTSDTRRSSTMMTSHGLAEEWRDQLYL